MTKTIDNIKGQTIQLGDIVGISFKNIYLHNDMYLKYGGYIRFASDNEYENEYYDVINCKTKELLYCDGEEFQVLKITRSYFVFRHLESNKVLWLSREETELGCFI